MTKEELKKRIDSDYITDESLVPNEILDAGIHLKEFIGLINQGYASYEEEETRTLLATVEVVQSYFELLEKLRDKIE